MVKRALFVFFLLFILMSTLGMLVQNYSLGYGVLVTEWGIVLLVPLAYAWKKGMPLRENFPLRPVAPQIMLITFLLAVTGWSLANFAGGIIAAILIKWGLTPPTLPLHMPANPWGYFVMFFGISISAGICEEAAFRGFILNNLRSWGAARSIFFGALFFAMLHVSFFRFMPVFLLGLLYGYMVYRTRSLLPSIIAHAVNNALSLVLFILYEGGKIEGGANTGGKITATAQSLTAADLSLAMGLFLLFLTSAVAFPFLIRALQKRTNVREEPNAISEEPDAVPEEPNTITKELNTGPNELNVVTEEVPGEPNAVLDQPKVVTVEPAESLWTIIKTLFKSWTFDLSLIIFLIFGIIEILYMAGMLKERV